MIPNYQDIRDIIKNSLKKQIREYSISCKEYISLVDYVLDEMTEFLMDNMSVILDEYMEEYRNGMYKTVPDDIGYEDEKENLNMFLKNLYKVLKEEMEEVFNSLENVIYDTMETKMVYIDEVAEFIYNCPAIVSEVISDKVPMYNMSIDKVLTMILVDRIKTDININGNEIIKNIVNYIKNQYYNK